MNSTRAELIVINKWTAMNATCTGLETAAILKVYERKNVQAILIKFYIFVKNYSGNWF